MFPVYAPSPPVCYIHVSEYMCLSFPVRMETKCNTGKEERDWLCLHYQARETRAFWIPCLVYPYFGGAGGNRSSIFHQIFAYITRTCSYCVFYTNRWLQKNFPFSFSARKIDLLTETHNQEYITRPETLYLL